jgi:hypothetical protein
VRSRRSDASTAARTAAGVIGAPSRTCALPGPVILVAITRSSRRPVRAIQSPMISSVRPTVSARTGLVGYISAVSRKSTPRSSAMSICAWALGRVVLAAPGHRAEADPGHLDPRPAECRPLHVPPPLSDGLRGLDGLREGKTGGAA